jgi:hypothetical protein
MPDRRGRPGSGISPDLYSELRPGRAVGALPR